MIYNKVDLPAAWSRVDDDAAAVEISVRTGAGLDALHECIGQALGAGTERRDHPQISNVRHVALLNAAAAALDHATQALDASDDAISEEFVLADLQDAVAALQEVTGRRTTDDLLTHIFSRFCIGK